MNQDPDEGAPASAAEAKRMLTAREAAILTAAASAVSLVSAVGQFTGFYASSGAENLLISSVVTVVFGSLASILILAFTRRRQSVTLRWPTILLASAVLIAAGWAGGLVGKNLKSQTCFFSVGEDGVLGPSPTKSENLTFCPARVNGGTLPTTGKFELEGQVLGSRNLRKQVVLVDFGDPRTCDANGGPPAPGKFFVPEANIGSSNGSWSYIEPQGYAEAVTLGRIYQYVQASDASIEYIKRDRARWVEEGKPPKDYPGITDMPTDAEVLSSFEVPGGRFTGKTAPCKN